MLKKICYKELNMQKICIFTLILILVWWGMVLIPSYTSFDSTIKRLLMTVFLIFMLKYFDKDLKLKLTEMWSRFDFKNLIYSFIGIFIWLFAFRSLVSQKICSFNFSNYNFERYIDLFVLSVYEEIFFRGWVYTASWSLFDKCKTNKNKFFNKFSITLSEVKAIILSSLFFAIIHLQAYVAILNYNFLQTISGLIQVFFIGTFFALIFRKTKSIWNVILVHFFWDYILGIMVC